MASQPGRHSWLLSEGLTTLLMAAWLTAACATTKEEVVTLRPMKFTKVEHADGAKAEALDDEALFRAGGRAFEKKDYATAAGKYRLVVEQFPESRYADVSRFNAGLALERDGRCEEALPFFRELAKRTAGSKDAHDAYFHLASCFERLRRWADAEHALTRILKPEFPDITVIDRVEARARRGLARHRQSDLAMAERDYLAALELHRQNLGNRALLGNYHVSQAQFQIGELYRELFGTIRFRLPLERMARDLEDKANFFLKAQNAYLKTVRHYHPKFAVAAGFRLGAIYEQFYDDMMAAEIPDDMTPEEIDVYHEELRKYVEPLVVRAIDIYERNIRLARRLAGGDGEWVRKSQASLARLKEVLRRESTRAVESKLKR